jgi:hypothetical protein
MNTYTAYLRVRHPSIDPGEITRELGLEPAHAWAAGAPRGEAALARGAHAESYWFAPLGESVWRRLEAGAAGLPAAGDAWPFGSTLPPLETFLLSQMRLLAPHRGFFARLGTEGGTCELAVTLSARERFSVELPAGLLRSLAELGISITLDVSTGEEPVSH